MARIPYASIDEGTALVQRIKNERGGRLLNLYRMLLHSPSVAAGWLSLFTAIRQQSSLPADLRELAILRIALINGADYEYQAHVPFALEAGLTSGQLAELPAWESGKLLGARFRAVLAYTDAMTKDIRVTDKVFAALAEQLNNQELVELTATIAGYNLVSRFLEAMQIDHD